MTRDNINDFQNFNKDQINQLIRVNDELSANTMSKFDRIEL